MSTFHLKVLTASRVFFDDDVDCAVVRTTEGDVGIKQGHVDYVAALGIGGLTITANGASREAAIFGGFVDVTKDSTVILARTCEWADEIDINRAHESEEHAKALLHHKASAKEGERADIKLIKAINRIRIAQK